MDFLTLLALDLIVAVPCLTYYLWSVIIKGKKANADILVKLTKNAYIFTAFTIIYIPLLLLSFLYINLLRTFPLIFIQTALVIAILIVVFEYINYYSYINFERVGKKK